MRTNHVQKSLISIHKLVKAHAEAADDFNKATDAMHLMLGEHVKALGAAAEGDPSIQGYVGHLNKLCKAHQSGHGAGKMAHTAFHAAVKKALDGAALKAGVDLSIGNANSTEASNDTTHGGGNTTRAGRGRTRLQSGWLDRERTGRPLQIPGLSDSVQQSAIAGQRSAEC